MINYNDYQYIVYASAFTDAQLAFGYDGYANMKDWLIDTIKTLRKFNKKVLVMKYEDLVLKKKDSILRLVEFFNHFFPLKIDKQKLENCLRTTSFKYLSSMEESEGFGESVSSKDEKKIQFFNKGLVGNWKNILSPKISNEIEINFKNEMTELGYF